MSDKDPQTSGGDKDPSGSGNQPPTTPPAGGQKAGAGDTGPKMVLETDLLTLKTKAEGLERQLTESQTAHDTALTKVGGEHEVTRQRLLATEAKVTTLEERSKNGESSSEELVQARKLYGEAISKGVDLTNQLLDLRRAAVVTVFGISADSVKEKSMEELGHLEEALKLVTAGKGSGPYALGGSGAGGAPQTAKERANAILAEADKKRAGSSPSGE